MKLRDLVEGTRRLRTHQYPTRKIGAVDYKYVPESKQLFISGQAIPLDPSSRSSPYKMSIVFKKIESSPTEDKKHPFVFSKDGHTIDRYLTMPTVSHEVMVRCQCFTGDTLVLLADGSSVKMRELVGLGEFYVYSYDLNYSKPVIAKAHSARMTDTEQQLVEVILDNGKSIKCTPDHKFLLKNGEYKQAFSLVNGDSLMSIYKDQDESGHEIITADGRYKEVVIDNLFNHKVSSVSYIGSDDVYCLTVPEYHNFAIDDGEGNGVLVHNCDDFYFMWQYWDKGVKSLLGPHKTYRRKTKHYPPRNPGQVPGLCKHLLMFTKLLMESGALKEQQKVKQYLNRRKRPVSYV